MYVITLKDQKPTIQKLPSRDFVQCAVFGTWHNPKDCMLVKLTFPKKSYCLSAEAQSLSESEIQEKIEKTKNLFHRCFDMRRKVLLLNEMLECGITVAALKDLIKDLNDDDNVLFKYEGNGSSTDFDTEHYGEFQKPEKVVEGFYIIATA